MKRWLFLGCLAGLVFFVQGQSREKYRYALLAEVSNRKAGIGFQYAWKERWFLPCVAGWCNEFQERKWNDGYVEVQPYFLFGKGKVRFPAGLIGGIRWMNDYGHRFSSWFYGCYGGGIYRIHRHGWGIKAGVKAGRKYHLLKHTENWGTTETYEKYRERPLFFSVYYQYEF